jgi:hypothetical protein
MMLGLMGISRLWMRIVPFGDSQLHEPISLNHSKEH